MLEAAQLLALMAFVALALAIAVFIRRAGRLLAEIRQAEVFRRTVNDLAARAAASLDGVAARIDGVRRKTLAAQDINDNLEAASDAVERYLAEARALHGPAETNDIRDSIATELERAGRALQMVEHGCSILASARVGGRELEAQTAIKRGYLNVLHAREAILRHAARAANIGPHDVPSLFERRNA